LFPATGLAALSSQWSKPLIDTGLRDIRFLLFEQFRLHELLGAAPFEDWSR